MPQYLGLDFYALCEQQTINNELGIENKFKPFIYESSDQCKHTSIDLSINATNQSQPQSANNNDNSYHHSRETRIIPNLVNHSIETPIVINNANLVNIRRNQTTNQNESTVRDVIYGANTATANHSFQTKLNENKTLKMEIMSQTLDNNDNLKSKYFSDMSNQFRSDSTYNNRAKISDYTNKSRVSDTPVESIFGGKWRSQRTQSLASQSLDKPVSSTPLKSHFTMNSQLNFFEQSVRNKTIKKTAENSNNLLDHQIKRNRHQILNQLAYSQPNYKCLNKSKHERREPITFNFESSTTNGPTFEELNLNNSGNTTIINQNFNFFSLYNDRYKNVFSNIKK